MLATVTKAFYFQKKCNSQRARVITRGEKKKKPSSEGKTNSDTTNPPGGPAIGVDLEGLRKAASLLMGTARDFRGQGRDFVAIRTM